MAALSANKCTDTREQVTKTKSYPVAASAHIYRGSIVCTNASGYAAPGADTANFHFVGVALEEADNSSGSNGDITVQVVRCEFKVASGETETVDSVGELRYISDDQTVAAAATTTNDILVGAVTEFVDASTVWVDPFWRVA